VTIVAPIRSFNCGMTLPERLYVVGFALKRIITSRSKRMG